MKIFIMRSVLLKFRRYISSAISLSNSKILKEDLKNLEHCNVGTIGHVDHGKTTLTSAITKVLEKGGFSKYVSYENIDRAPDEKSRGITINIAHVSYSSKKRHYAHTDCPGHADFIKNMISGASQMDGAILVVAANDGQMPQTKEHLLLAKQIGVKRVIVFINKADIVDKDILDIVELEMIELLEYFGFDPENCPFVKGSALLALKGDNGPYGEKCIYELVDVLDKYVLPPKRDNLAPFCMPIDNFVSVPGRGTVVIGTLLNGTIKKGDNAEFLGFGQRIPARIGAIQVFKQNVDKIESGHNLGALVKGIKIDELKRGMWMCAPKHFSCCNRFEAMLYYLNESEGGRSTPLKSKCNFMIYSTTWNIACRLDFLDADMIMPGEYGRAQVTLRLGMVLMDGQQFTIREPGKTLFTGKIVKLLQNVHVPNSQLSKVDFNLTVS